MADGWMVEGSQSQPLYVYTYADMLNMHNYRLLHTLFQGMTKYGASSKL